MVSVDVTVGPSRSPNFPRAVAYGRRYASDAEDIGEGRYRFSFDLGNQDPELYACLGRLLTLVQHWRATEIDVDDEPAPAYLVSGMAFCAHGYAKAFGRCSYYDLPPSHVRLLRETEDGFREQMVADHLPQPLAKCFICPLFPGTLRRPTWVPGMPPDALPDYGSRRG